MGDTQDVFIVCSWRVYFKNSPECNSVFVYWLFLTVVEIKRIERDPQSTRTFIKRQEVSDNVL